MTFFGYARASTDQQRLDEQLEILKQAGVVPPNIFFDSLKQGQDEHEPTGLDRLFRTIGFNDVVLVTRLDRLGRSLGDLIQLLDRFNDKGVIVRFLEDDLSTEGPQGPLMVRVLTAVARTERLRLRERTSEGRIEARQKGVKFGRKPSIDREMIRSLHAQGLGAAEIARQMHIGRSTVYKILQSLIEGG
ncbi:recombinase family protein [Desulfobulbus propionicus]|jgi:DNA invertase Pin-like site-specific DNA recombinase